MYAKQEIMLLIDSNMTEDSRRQPSCRTHGYNVSSPIYICILRVISVLVFHFVIADLEKHIHNSHIANSVNIVRISNVLPTP